MAEHGTRIAAGYGAWRAITVSAVTAALSVPLMPAVAADVALAPPKGAFYENYDDEAPVSGSPLVGLALGFVDAPLDLAGATLVAPPHQKRICVRAVTRDGRYVASNPYAIEGQAQGGPVRLAPLTRGFERQLAGYDQTSFALRAYVEEGENCNPAGALHLPQIRSPAADAPLVVMANGQSRTATARLLDTTGAEVASAACVAPGGAALIAFDLVCELSRERLPDGGRAALELVFNDGFGDDVLRFSVMLPPADR